MTQEETTVVPDNPIDIRNLQDKFHNLLEERNKYNDLARQAREDRNLLHTKRREKAETIEAYKKERDELNTKAGEHRERRNQFQDQAKGLIGQRKGPKGGADKSVAVRVRKLRTEIEAALQRQETSVLSVEKERDLVDTIRKQRHELAGLEAELAKATPVTTEADVENKAIDELFKHADEEHAASVELHKKANELHEKFIASVKEVRILQKEADEKHKGFIVYKEKADSCHTTAMEMREQVVAVRGERIANAKARRQEITDFNKGQSAKLNDPDALKKLNDDAMESLKSGGKISLGF